MKRPLEIATHDIARRMKASREQKDISVEKVAFECGLSPDLIRSFESGSVIVPAFVLFCFAKLVDEPIESFMNEAYEKHRRWMAEPLFVTRMRERAVRT